MSKTYNRPADFHRAWARRLDGHVVDARRGVQEIARASRLDWLDLTRGRVSSKSLRAMGHPFGRSGGIQRGQTVAGRSLGKAIGGRQFTTRGVIRPLPINRQSGRLNSGITMRSAGANAYEISSTATHARYILAQMGTRKMVGRGFSGVSPSLAVRLNSRSTSMQDGEVTKRWRARNAALLTKLRTQLRK